MSEETPSHPTTVALSTTPRPASAPMCPLSPPHPAFTPGAG